MGHATGEAKELPLRPVFDRRIKLKFHGARITCDGGLLAYREHDDALGAHNDGRVVPRGASPKKRFCATMRPVPALAALPSALEQRKVGLQRPASGESRLSELDPFRRFHIHIR